MVPYHPRTNPPVTIDDSLGVVLTVDGVDIYSTKDGKFAAVVNGAIIKLASKLAVAKRVQGNQHPIPCMDLHHGNWGTPEVQSVVRVTPNRQVVYLREDPFRKGKFHEATDGESNWYFYDAETHAKLAEINAKRKALDEEYHAVRRTLTPVNAATFAERQAAIREAAAQPSAADE